MPDRLSTTILDMIESAQRTITSAPLNLGGLPGPGGGIGLPPGGFIGYLPQTRVAYDSDEIASSGTPASGMSLLDNLNHIRYRIGVLESGSSITVVDSNLDLSYFDIDTIYFSGAGVVVNDLGAGDIQVVIAATGSGGGGAALTVQEFDGSPTISNVDTIVFSGLVVSDLGSGDVGVTVSGMQGLPLFFDTSDSDISTYDNLIRGLTTPTTGNNSVTVTGAATLIKAFALDYGQFSFIPEQIIHAKMWLGKSGGTKQAQFYISLYHRTSGGTETLLGTSSLTPSTTDSITHSYDLYITVPDTSFATTDRFVAKVFANPVGAGTDPAVYVAIGTTQRSKLVIGIDINSPVAETNANDIFRCNSPGGASLWTGTISGAPSGTSVTVSAPVTGTEAVLVPNSTSQLAKMRLYNLTRGNYTLISNYNTGTNVVTLTATVPGTWANGDSLTIASQTVSGGGYSWIDLELTSGPLGKANMFINLYILSATVGHEVHLHPFETYADSKLSTYLSQVANILIGGMILQRINGNMVSMAWTGTPTRVVVREAGY